eukprot:244978-Pyramimonas_sp.AAC.1
MNSLNRWQDSKKEDWHDRSHKEPRPRWFEPKRLRGPMSAADQAATREKRNLRPVLKRTSLSGPALHQPLKRPPPMVCNLPLWKGHQFVKDHQR